MADTKVLFFLAGGAVWDLIVGKLFINDLS